MKSSYIIAGAVVIVLIVGGVLWSSNSYSGSSGSPSQYPGYQGSTTLSPSQPTTATQPTNTQPTSNTTNSKTAGLAATVTYSDSGFSPATVTIAKGGTVTFKNTASDAMRVASNPHPIHNGYPTTGGCVGSTFDACRNIAPGSSWSFTFTYTGSWRYHNHLNPGEGGTVVVQ